MKSLLDMKGLEKQLWWWMISYAKCKTVDRMWPKEPPAKVLCRCDLEKSIYWE